MAIGVVSFPPGARLGRVEVEGKGGGGGVGRKREKVGGT